MPPIVPEVRPAVRRDPAKLALRAVALFAFAAASLGSVSLYGEVGLLRAELHASRMAELTARRTAERAALDAENARTALANAQTAPEADATDAPDAPETPDPGDANSDGDSSNR